MTFFHLVRHTPNTRRTAQPRWLVGLLAFAVAISVTGCRSNKGGFGSSFARNNEPLLGDRIPPQDLPIPARGDVYGSNNRADPLLDPGALPTSSGSTGTGTAKGTDNGKSDRAGNDMPKPKEAASRMPPPDRPYRPGRESTTAALAALPIDDTDLSIGPRGGVVPAGGITASIPGRQRDDLPASTNGFNYDQIVDQLNRMGAKFSRPERDNGLYHFHCDVPVRGAMPGVVRRYEGTGSSPAAAAKSVLDQLRADGYRTGQ